MGTQNFLHISTVNFFSSSYYIIDGPAEYRVACELRYTLQDKNTLVYICCFFFYFAKK